MSLGSYKQCIWSVYCKWIGSETQKVRVNGHPWTYATVYAVMQYNASHVPIWLFSLRCACVCVCVCVYEWVKRRRAIWKENSVWDLSWGKRRYLRINSDLWLVITIYTFQRWPFPSRWSDRCTSLPCLKRNTFLSESPETDQRRVVGKNIRFAHMTLMSR